MKKTKKAVFAAESCLLAMAAFGCVYGPPPDEEDVMTPPSTTTAESEILTSKSDKQKQDEYDPAKEEMQDVYGPPISFTINY